MHWPPVYGRKLTQLEVMFLQLIVDGHSSSEAALAMNITKKTAEFYSANVRYALKATTLAHAAALAVKEGIVRPPDPAPLDLTSGAPARPKHRPIGPARVPNLLNVS